MTRSDFPEFLQSLMGLAGVFDRAITEAVGLAYFNALEDVPIAAVRMALTQAARTATWFPRPVELRALAGAGLPDESAVWDTLNRLGRVTGASLRAPAMSDGFYRLVDRLGGWRTFWGLSADEQRRRYERAYRDLARTDAGLAFDCPAQTAALAGQYRGPVLATDGNAPISLPEPARAISGPKRHHGA
jgi:hypothetical protein